MALRRILEVVLALFLVAVALSGGRAMADSDCDYSDVDLSACYDYSSPENISTYLSECCSQLSNVVNKYSHCVCDAIERADSADRTVILNGLHTCNITTCDDGGDASDAGRIRMPFADYHFFPVLLIMASIFVSIYTAIV